MPCFDQPNLKAKYSLTLSMPTDWTAIANGPLQSEEVINDKRVIVFGETKPVSTYIFAFTAGKFQRVTQQKDGRKMTMLHRETDLAKVERNKDEIFDLHSRALSWMEKYTGIDYPFQKFDFALIPGFQYGGMEHPGAIFYRDASLLLELSATKNQYLRRQPLKNLNLAGTLYGSIIYSKAPVVMKHLELIVGEKMFQKGIQIYLSNHSYGNATWSDLISILDDLSKEDLRAWSKVWVDEPDRPIVEYDLEVDNDSFIKELKLKQADPKKRNRIWMQHLKVRLGYENNDIVIPAYLNDKEIKISEAKGMNKPNYILPNGVGVGYGYFKMDPLSRSFLLENLPEFNDPYLRGIIWLNL